MPAEVILIIEDDVHIARLVAQVLREAGYAPALVRDVDAARAESARGLRPRAVLSDLMVAGSDGPEQLAAQLERLFPSAPVTLMTGVPAKRRATLGVTHERIIEKPFELEALLEAVRTMVESKDSRSDVKRSVPPDIQVFRGRHELRGHSSRPEASRSDALATMARIAIALGTFDGVHHGHRALITRACALAAARGARAGVLTFDPHPACVVARAVAPPLILPLERRIELIAEAGASFVLVEPFTPELARVEAEAFVRDILARDLDVADVVVGYDFTFGRGRAGTPALLKSVGARCGIHVEVVEPVTVDGVVCSSTRIRKLIADGDVQGAAALLGRPVEVSGTVVAGAGRGRVLGIRTANLRSEAELIPRIGIYAGRAIILDEAKTGTAWPAAISIGTNPTFQTQAAASPITVEAHLIDFHGDLYGRRLRIELLAWLRDQRRFAGPEELIEQMTRDIAQARDLARSPHP